MLSHTMLVLVIDFLAVDLDAGIGVAVGPAGELPEAVLVEAELVRPLEPTLELPLADDAGGVAGVLEDIAEGRGLRVKQAELDVVGAVVPAGHDLHA